MGEYAYLLSSLLLIFEKNVSLKTQYGVKIFETFTSKTFLSFFSRLWIFCVEHEKYSVTPAQEDMFPSMHCNLFHWSLQVFDFEYENVKFFLEIFGWNHPKISNYWNFDFDHLFTSTDFDWYKVDFFCDKQSCKLKYWSGDVERCNSWCHFDFRIQLEVIFWCSKIQK